ncbi:MAG: hypothetical protein J0M04_13505 [Verrucomicrobia bacterium]|nr:hypothetical protein [Verrucomicrobiota bacterium]
MSQDLHELETKLHALRPAAPGNELAARLADIARPAPAADPALEAALRALRPAAFGTDLTASVLRRTTGAQPAVIPFHKPTRSWNRYMLPVAAAVALLGAAAALLVPTSANRGGNTIANNPTPADPPIPTTIPRENGNPALVPASFGTDLTQAKDEGVLWQGPNQARRVVKVIYRDRGTYVTPDGRKVEVEIPRVEYILVPEKLD